MKDFSKVRYLKFSAEDSYECTFRNVVIDLVEDRLIQGFITIGSIEDGENRYTIDVSKNLHELKNDDYSIFAKVVDEGIYHLLDENMNECFVSEGYVPSLMDYYNTEEGFGDYIDLLIDDINTGKLVHNERSKISYNDPDDWTEVEQTPNLYAKGMMDAFSLIEKTIVESDNTQVAVTNIMNIIMNFKDRENKPTS